jgi:hypothetical protein
MRFSDFLRALALPPTGANSNIVFLLNKMDPFTICIAVIAFLSEVLPLLGFTKANGILHGFKHFVLHIHADSECNVDLTSETTD